MSKTPLIALGAGTLFGAGLAISTMVNPASVLAFLRFDDFGLLLVLGGAVAVALATYQLAPRWLEKPLLDGRQFDRHPSEMSRRTLIGAAIFGAGWGLCGVCPGPAIAGLGTGNASLLLALAGIFAGAWVHGRFFGKAD